MLRGLGLDLHEPGHDLRLRDRDSARHRGDDQSAGEPLFYIFRIQLGAAALTALKVVVFIAMFSALLANMAVGTRMTYSLARDGMFPASRALPWVNPRTQTPMVAIALVAVMSFAVNFFSTGIENRVVSIAAVCYYATYALTLVAALWAHSRGRLPDPYPGGFGLGRWLAPIAGVSVVFAIIIVIDETAPSVNYITTAGHPAWLRRASAAELGYQVKESRRPNATSSSTARTRAPPVVAQGESGEDAAGVRVGVRVRSAGQLREEGQALGARLPPVARRHEVVKRHAGRGDVA